MTAPNTPLGSFLEGLAGGAKEAFQFRTDIQERKRRAATEDERLQMERAQELRAAVGFQLQQKVRQAELDKYQRDLGQPIEVSPGATLHYPGGQQPDWTAPVKPNESSNYELRQGPNGEWTWIPKPGAAPSSIGTGIIGPPPPSMIVPSAEGLNIVDRPRGQTPTVRPLAGPAGAQLQGPVPEAANKAIQDNNALIAQIDRATELLKANPKATGLGKKALRMIPFVGPQALAQSDSSGDEVRVALNQINVSTVHEMFGGALTPTEVKRTDFAPDIGFDLNANLRRLEGLRRKAATANATLLKQHPGAKGVQSGPQPASQPRPVTKADLWEHYREQGLSPDEATARVNQEMP